MKAEVKSQEKPVLEKIAGKLMKAQQELDELVLQLSLGKAEAREKFEEIKKEFKAQVSELKQTFNNSSLKETGNKIKAMLEELELQLALGKADSVEIFEAQSKKILLALHELEHEIKERLPQTEEVNFFKYDIESFKLKLEILRLKLLLKNFEIKDVFKERMNDARNTIEKLKTSAKEKLGSGKGKYSDFKDEVQLAYKHLRKALESL